MDLSSGPTLKVNNDKQFFKLSCENSEFIVQFGIEDKKLKVFCQDITQFNNLGYKNYFSLENVKQLNRLFLCFSNLEEVLSIFNDLMKKNKIKIKKENENLILIVTINNLVGNEEQINLKLNESLLSNNDLTNNFCLKVNHLRQIIEEEKRKNENLEKRITELEKKKFNN